MRGLPHARPGGHHRPDRPNLDEAFAAAREGGMDGATVEGVVKAQVDNPRPAQQQSGRLDARPHRRRHDLDDIAAYLGKYAGVPGAEPPEVEGPGRPGLRRQRLWRLPHAGRRQRGGTVGPDLDEVLPGQQGIRNRRIDRRSGSQNRRRLPTGSCRRTSKNIQPEKLKELVEYLSESAGKE